MKFYMTYRQVLGLIALQAFVLFILVPLFCVKFAWDLLPSAPVFVIIPCVLAFLVVFYHVFNIVKFSTWHKLAKRQL